MIFGKTSVFLFLGRFVAVLLSIISSFYGLGLLGSEEKLKGFSYIEKAADIGLAEVRWVFPCSYHSTLLIMKLGFSHFCSWNGSLNNF